MAFLLEKFFFVASLLVATVASCISCSPSVLHHTVVLGESQEAVKYWPSLAKVQTVPMGKEKGYFMATAWAITPDQLMTAGHFCNGAQDQMLLKHSQKYLVLQTVDEQGRPDRKIKGTIRATVNEDMDDMCIIDSPGHGLVPVEIETNLKLVETEDRITIVGGPRGYFPIRRDGYVWAVADDALLVAVEIQPGNSGGPVFWQGKVIGMVVMSIGELNEAGIAVRSDKLLEFIEEHLNK